MSLRRALPLTAALLWSHSALAGPYLAPSLAVSSTQYSDVKSAVGYNLAGGYQFERLPVFIEAAYFDSRELKIDDFQDPQVTFSGGKLNFRGERLYVGYALPLGRRSQLWLKAGYHALDSQLVVDQITVTTSQGTATGQNVSLKQGDHGLSWGLGGEWMFPGTSHVGLRLEVELAQGLHSIPTISDEKTPLTSVLFGVVWRPRFGEAIASATPRSAPPMVEPATAPTAPAVMPAAAAPAPAASAHDALRLKPVSPPPDANMTHAGVRPGTLLRAAPLLTATTLTQLDGQAPVAIEARVSNSSGQWCFVHTSRDEGWVLASDLLNP